MKRPRRTSNQKTIVGRILKHYAEGRSFTQKELFDSLPEGFTSYNALRVSIRILEEQGILVRSGPRGARLLVPTTLAFQYFTPER